MKTVSGKVTSTIPISLSKAAKSLSKFASSNHEASHAVSLYLQRASDSFNHLVKVHQKLNPQNDYSNDDIKVDEISESKKNREVGLKVDDVVNNEVKNEDNPNGCRENKKSKNLGESAKNNKMNDQKLIKTEKRVDISEGETVKSKKNEDMRNGSQENKKSKNLGKEENTKADTKRNKTKNSAKIDEVKRVDIGEGEIEKSKKNEVEFVKIDYVKKLIKTEERLDIGEGEMEKSKKNEVEFVKIDKVKGQKLIKTEQLLDIGEGETEKSKKNELKLEPELNEVKEDGVTSKDKKKRKKKNRGVGESEQEAGKVDEDMGNKAEEEGKKRKGLDHDAGENAVSTEQSSKKKSKKRRIEGEK